MKRMLALLLALTMVFTLCACGAAEPAEPAGSGQEGLTVEEMLKSGKEFFECFAWGTSMKEVEDAAALVEQRDREKNDLNWKRFEIDVEKGLIRYGVHNIFSPEQADSTVPFYRNRIFIDMLFDKNGESEEEYALNKIEIIGSIDGSWDDLFDYAALFKEHYGEPQEDQVDSSVSWLRKIKRVWINGDTRIRFEGFIEDPARNPNQWIPMQNEPSLTFTMTLTPAALRANLDWSFDKADGTLTIRGSGDMEDYAVGDAPWSEVAAEVENVVIEAGVTGIGASAFYKYPRLTRVTIPNGVTRIGYSAFYGCGELSDITIPDSVTGIGNSAFCNCSKLESITIPDSVTSLEKQAFLNCSSLTSVTLSNSLTHISACLFEGCKSLIYVEIPDGVISIDERAFSYCESMYEIVIPDGVTEIGEMAFRNCQSLTGISIPDSVTSIGDEAFSDCKSLTDVYYSGSEAQWNAIAIGSGNHLLTRAALHFGAAPQPAATPKPTETPKPTATPKAPEPTETPEPVPTPKPKDPNRPKVSSSGTYSGTKKAWYCEKVGFTVWLPGEYAAAKDTGFAEANDLELSLEIEDETERITEYIMIQALPSDRPDLTQLSEEELNRQAKRFLDVEMDLGRKVLDHGVIKTQDVVWVWMRTTNDGKTEAVEYYTYMNGHYVNIFFFNYVGFYSDDEKALCDWTARSISLGKPGKKPA